MLGKFKPKPNSHPPEHKIHLKLKIATQLLQQRKDTLDYYQLIFLLTARRIPQNLIRMFLSQIHKDNFQNIASTWQSALKHSKIVEDVFAVKRKMVEEQWVQTNINERHHKLKQEQYQGYEAKVKNNQDVRIRIKSLKDESGIVEGRIQMAKSDEESLKLREEYRIINEEYTFWRNRERKIKQLSQEKAVNQSSRNNEVDLNVLFQAIEERYAEELRQSSVKNMGFTQTSNLPKEGEKAQGYTNNRMKALEAIFEDYAKKEFKQSMLFDEMLNSKDHLSLENFLRFMTDGGIETHLNLQEKVKIFKERSQFDRKINFLTFTEILQDICSRQCQKLKLKYNSRILDIFVDEMISKVKQKNNPPSLDFLQGDNVSPLRQQHTNNLRNKVVSNYQYRLRSHTGMYPQGIEENLKQRKKERQIATEESLQAKNSRSTYNNKSLIKFIHKNRDKKSRLNTFDVEASHPSHLKASEQKNSQPTINRYEETSTKKKNSFSHFQQKDSYSNMFYRKIANHLKHKRHETDFSKMSNLVVREHHVGDSVQPVPNRKDRYSGPIQLKVDTEIVKHRQKQQARDALEEELQGMVKLQQEDFFLTSHLQVLEKVQERGRKGFHY